MQQQSELMVEVETLLAQHFDNDLTPHVAQSSRLKFVAPEGVPGGIEPTPADVLPS